ncbi:unnamed protein product, partial [Onchocerca ochengi]
DVTRFLWLKDKSKEATQENLVTFRFARVPFGVVSSPFPLAAVTRHLLSEESSKLLIEIAKNLYVDNVVLTSENLWKKGMLWDEKLEPEEMRRCLEIEKAFNQFDVIEAPRWTPQEYSEMHVLVNASEKAVGLAIYARGSSSTPCKPQLIYGKTRLIPKRENRNQSASIPRLELLAVTFGVRALEFIRRKIEVEKAYLWTDNASVLHCLRKPPVRSRYISNRTDEISRCKDIEFRM